MTGRRFHSMLLTTLTALVLLTAGSVARLAAQQNPNCCSYSVEITGVKPECFPFRIKTQWVPGFTDIITYSANGVYWNPIPAPCPPAPAFDWVSLDLGMTQVRLGETKVFWVGKCCYKVTATLNPNFCILIQIVAC